MNFHSIEINKELQNQLSTAVDTDRLPHAIILEGASEKGRLELARLLSRTHICSAASGKPCDICSDCTKAAKGFHPDVSESLASQDDSTPLKVDAIRTIRSNAFVFPNEAKRRVFLLHNMQYANEQAQNALLKILEEPPEYVRFILTCPNSSALLQTILSRATVYNLGQQLSDSLNKKHDEACEKTRRIAAALISPNEFDLMKETGIFEKDQELMILTLAQLRLVFRDAISRKQNSATTFLSCAEAQATALSRTCTLAQLFKLMEAVGELEKNAAQNANKTLLVTRFCSLMRRAQDK